jgi:hypothetical protein
VSDVAWSAAHWSPVIVQIDVAEQETESPFRTLNPFPADRHTAPVALRRKLPVRIGNRSVTDRRIWVGVISRHVWVVPEWVVR